MGEQAEDAENLRENACQQTQAAARPHDRSGMGRKQVQPHRCTPSCPKEPVLMRAWCAWLQSSP